MSPRELLTQKDSAGEGPRASFLRAGPRAQPEGPGPLPPSPTGTLTGTHIEMKIFLSLILGVIFLDLVLKGVLSPLSASDPSLLLLPLFCSLSSPSGPDHTPCLWPMHNDGGRVRREERLPLHPSLLLALRPSASLCLSFFSCNLDITTLTSVDCHED